jgi:hypothetical protein
MKIREGGRGGGGDGKGGRWAQHYTVRHNQMLQVLSKMAKGLRMKIRREQVKLFLN